MWRWRSTTDLQLQLRELERRIRTLELQQEDERLQRASVNQAEALALVLDHLKLVYVPTRTEYQRARLDPAPPKVNE